MGIWEYGKDDKMAKEQIRVIMVEAFNGKKYIIRLDKDYEEVLMNLLNMLFGNNKLGSVACISIRLIKREEYNKVKPTPEIVEVGQKGMKDGKEEDIKEDSEEV